MVKVRWTDHVQFCERCGQALPEMRCGVRLTPLKARIFDAIKRAGQDGIDPDDLHWIVLTERGAARHNTLKAHVYQINEALSETGYAIRYRYRSWRLVKKRSP